MCLQGIGLETGVERAKGWGGVIEFAKSMCSALGGHVFLLKIKILADIQAMLERPKNLFKNDLC